MFNYMIDLMFFKTKYSYNARNKKNIAYNIKQKLGQKRKTCKISFVNT